MRSKPIYKLFRSAVYLASCMLALPAIALVTPQADIEGLSPEDAAQKIFLHAESLGQDWKSARSLGTIYLKNSESEEAEAKMTLESWSVEGDDRYKKTKKKLDAGATFIKYDSDGTGLLTFMYRNAKDIQWVWVPAMSKKIRINTSGLTGAFVGSEFSIEDMRSHFPEKYQSRILSEEPCKNVSSILTEGNCWKIERIPKKKKTGYSKLIVWVEQQHYRTAKVEFYDKRKKLLKTMTTDKWSLHKDRWWRTRETTMANHQTGRSSTIAVEELELDIGLKKTDFDANRKLIK